MKRISLVITVLALALTSLAALVPAYSAARVGAAPPSFTLPAVVGGPTRGRFRMDDHLGRNPIVILFWGTWCAPCRQEIPFYQSLYVRHRATGLQVVGIAMDDTSTITQVGPAARRLGVTFPILSDLDTRVSSQMNPRRAAPFSVWVNRAGRIVREREGFSLAERDALTREMAQLVAR
jgi:peroxiredoxin